jgi:hypothetical protein
MLINRPARAALVLWVALSAGAATAQRAPVAGLATQAGRGQPSTDTTHRVETVRVTDTAAIRAAVSAALAEERNSEERIIRRWVIISLIVLGGMFLVFLGVDFLNGREVWIESHWGGLGGGVGGVRISRPLALLVLLLVAGGMLTAVTVMGTRAGTTAATPAAEGAPTATPKTTSPSAEPTTSGRGG